MQPTSIYMSLANIVVFDKVPVVLSAEFLEDFVNTLHFYFPSLSSSLVINPVIAKLVTASGRCFQLFI